MRRTVFGVVAVVAASSVFLLTGLGVAGAASLPANSPTAVAAASSSSEAATLRTLHDNLEAQWNAKDAGGMRATQAALAVELAKLRSGGVHQAMTQADDSVLKQASQENAQLGAELNKLGSHGSTPADLPVPGLGSLCGLVSSLLENVLAIIINLLGGLPVPAPLPVG